MSMVGCLHTASRIAVAITFLCTASLFAATGEIQIRTGNEPNAACLRSPNSINVDIRVANLSDAVNGAQARISYDPALLTLNIGASTAAVNWSLVTLTDSSGLVTCAVVRNGGSVGPGPGPFTVATLVFAADTGQGSDTIDYQPDDDIFLTKLTTAGVDPLTISGANLTKTPSGLIVVNTPTATASSNSPVCSGGTLNLTGGPGGMSSYSWTGPNSFSSSDQSPSITNVTTAATGTYTLTVTDSNSCQNSAQTSVTIVAAPTANAGPDQSICAGSTATLAGSATNNTSAAWSGGMGSFNPDDTTLNAIYTPSAAEVTAGTVTLTLTATGTSPCANAVDSMTITIVAAPTANAGPDQSICAGSTATLAGSASNNTGVTWSGGTGSFNPNNTTLNAVYTPSAAEVTAGTVTLTLTATGNSPCGNAIDSMTITIVAAPTANAGPDQSICAGSTATLAGSATHAVGVSWSGGTGTFNPNNTTLNAVYTPSAAEVTAGTVTLTLSATGNAPCGNAVDSMTITIVAAPTANAGPDQSICAGSTATLAGSATHAASIAWSGGTGTFNPNNTTLNPTYTPSAAEVTAGTVTLTLTATGNSPCGIASDTMTITIVAAPTANAGPDQSICAGSTATLAGSATNNTGVTWSGGTGTFNPNNTTLNAVYTPSAAEVTAGTVTLTLTATGNSPCGNAIDSMTITIVAAPTANAGPDQSICAGSTATLAGSASNNTGVTWSGGTGSFNPNNTTLNAVYTPSAAEVTAGTVTLTLSATGNAPCGNAVDSMTITIVAAPTANAGPDQSICAGSTATLAGSATHATGIAWSGGTGSFNPNNTALNAVYTPSAAEVTAGTVTLTLTATGNSPCTIATDTMTITIQGSPSVNAGPDQSICASSTVQLAGTASNATGVAWSGGTGTFNPNNTTLNAIYTPSAAEVTAGTVTLTLSGNAVSPCTGSASDSMTITITTTATANAGPDQSVCAGSTVQLAGTASNPAGASWSGGTGTFNPNNTTLNAIYTPSAAEVTAGTATLTLTVNAVSPCTGSASDSMTITIVAAPTANAGPDQSICAGSTATLAGSASNNTGVTWSGGTGSFNPNNTTLNAVYTPSAAEVTAGTVTLTLTATGNSPCGNAIDSMTITIVAAPTANAGPDQSICAGSTATLAGSATHAVGVSWSGGTGTFNPNNTTLNAVYTPSAAEVTAGTVTLTLSATGNAPCGNAVDSMTITIVAAPTANAGPDQSICAGSTATLAGSATHATGIAWSGGTGSFNPNNTALNAVYTPSAAEVTAGTVTLTLTATGNSPCTIATDTMTITIQGSPSVNAGPDQSICASSTVQLAGTASNATGVAWSGGTGTFNPNNTTLNAIYTPSAAEVTAGTVTLTLSGNAVSPCTGSASDSMTITITTTATANAGPDQSVCAGSTVQLAGTASNPAGASWSGGTGTFNPNNTTLNAIYTPSAAEVTAGTATLTLTVNAVSPCTGSASDSMTITIVAAPTANAGPDQSICAGSTATLAGSASNNTGVTWSGGTGSFNPNNTTLNAVYTPSAAEVTAGTVTLTLTATGNSPCGNAIDSMTITIVAAPTANAGPDQSICAGSTATLAGSATHAVGVSWSGGTGTFNPNNTTLNAVYTPSAAEVTAGTVTLTLSATGNAPCGNAVDSMTITIVAAPTANAGPDQSICAGSTATLAGSATHATGIAWSGGTGSFNPNNTALNAVYTPSAAEVTAGTVTLTLTATGNSPCTIATDTMTITIQGSPSVNAGPDQSICASSTVQLAGTASNATGVAWSGGTGTFNPNNTTLNAIYTPSAAEVTAGTVTLTLSGNAVSPCTGSASDSMTITITTTATANAGPDQSVCAGSTVQLAGTASNPAGASWSGGTGTFNPNNTTLNAIYTPSAAEVTAGTATLTLTVNAVSPCTGSASDSMTITIVAAPTANAGSNQTICGGGSVTLAGSATHAAGVAWTGGTGTFNPNNATLNAQYTPSAAEIAAGTVTLTLTATGNSPCASASDPMTITIQACVTLNIEIPGLIGTAAEGAHVADRAVEILLTACPGTTETRNQTVSFNRTGSNGTAQVILTNVNPSTDWMSVREAHTLRKLAAVDLSGDASDTVNVSLKSGDFQTSTITQDNLVDIVDFSILASRWSTVVSDCVSGDPEDCSLGADANGDGNQNTVDFTAIQINYFQVGDAADNCPPPVVEKPGGLRPIGTKRPLAMGGTPAPRGRSSMPVLELSALVSRVERADLTGDGVVDAADVRAFARANGFNLLPEFEAKLGPIAVDRPEAGE